MQICDAAFSAPDHCWKTSEKRFTRTQKTQQLAIQTVCRSIFFAEYRSWLKGRKSIKGQMVKGKRKVLKPYGFRTFVAAGEGFEPSHTESESAVLPLHKPAIFARSCRTNRYYYTGKQEFVKGFFEKNNICRFQPFSSQFPWKTPAPRASSEADLIIPQVRSGAESAFSLNFICHQRPVSLFCSPWSCVFRHGKDMDPDRDTCDPPSGK